MIASVTSSATEIAGREGRTDVRRARLAVAEHAVFQDLDVTAAYIRVRFGGDAPTLSPSRGDHFADADGYVSSDPESGFYADPDPGQWGA